MGSSKILGIGIGIIIVVVGIAFYFGSDQSSDSQSESMAEPPISDDAPQISDSATISVNQTTPKNYEIFASSTPIIKEN